MNWSSRNKCPSCRPVCPVCRQLLSNINDRCNTRIHAFGKCCVSGYFFSKVVNEPLRGRVRSDERWMTCGHKKRCAWNVVLIFLNLKFKKIKSFHKIYVMFFGEAFPSHLFDSFLHCTCKFSWHSTASSFQSVFIQSSAIKLRDSAKRSHQFKYLDCLPRSALPYFLLT